LPSDYRNRFRVKSFKKKVFRINTLLRIFMWSSLSLSFAILIFCAVAYISSSKVFNIKNITIKGCSYLRQEEILALLDIEMGDGIFKADLAAARNRLKEHPWIDDLTISRRLLPAAIVVSVMEQVPAAAININEKWYVANSKGKIFAPLPKGYNGLIIRSVGYVPNVNEMGEILMRCMAANRLLASKKINIESMEIESCKRMTIRLKTGIGITTLGEITPAKLDTALYVIEEVGPGPGTMLDLSCEDKIVLHNPPKEEEFKTSGG
jgi:cell division septal protein FtsQ